PDNIVNRLGIVAITITSQLKDAVGETLFRSGILVAARTPTSTLLGQGPQPGDIIHALNGMPVQDLAAFKQDLRKIKAGDPIVLQVERGGLLSYLVLESE